MAFTAATGVDASKSIFNDVGQNQYNIGQIQLAASPCLAPAFSVATFISSMAQQVRASREQVVALAASINTLLKTLDAEYHAERLLEDQTSSALKNLTEYVDNALQRNPLLISVETGEKLTEGDCQVHSEANN
jgi:hypothetical protein